MALLLLSATLLLGSALCARGSPGARPSTFGRCHGLQNGRIKGEAKKALRAVIEKYGIPVTITANQNLILQELEPAWKQDVLAMLAAGGIKDVSEWDPRER